MIETREHIEERLGAVLIEAEQTRVPVGPLSDLVVGGLTLDMAHDVCERNIKLRLASGERVAGFKIGFTNIAVREKMGLPDSTYGYLLDSMILPSSGEFPLDDLIAPKIETEICMRLGRKLAGRDLTIDEVIAATDAVSASFEVCDARIRDWKCPYPDFFADNGFSARIVVSGEWIAVDQVDLLHESVTLFADGQPLAEGKGAMALGHPANAVAWLVGKLAERGMGLDAGMVIMTGTLTPIIPIQRGVRYVGQFSTLGSVEKTFV